MPTMIPAMASGSAPSFAPPPHPSSAPPASPIVAPGGDFHGRLVGPDQLAFGHQYGDGGGGRSGDVPRPATAGPSIGTDNGSSSSNANAQFHNGLHPTASVAIADFFAPLGRSISASSMPGADYSAPFLSSHSPLGPFAGSFAAPTSSEQSNGQNQPDSNTTNELDLGLGWSSRNPPALPSPATHSTHHHQRANAASTLSSLSRPQQGRESGTVDSGEAGSKQTQGGVDATGRKQERKRPMNKSHAAGHKQRTRAQSGEMMASIFAPEEEEEEEEDELGGGPGDYAKQGTGAMTRGSAGYHLTSPSAGGSGSGGGGGGSGGWESGEGREAQGARKQNSACDACRNRKVRCNRAPGEDKCAHCKSKGIDCTTIFVQLASAGGKRPVKRARQSTEFGAESSLGSHTEEGITGLIKYLILRDADYPNAVHGLSYDLAEMHAHRTPPMTVAESRLANATARFDFVADLIETYFSIVHIRYPILDPQEFRQRFHHHTQELGGPPPEILVAVMLAWGAKFSENPIIVADRREAAHELTPTQKSKREAAAPSITAARLALSTPVIGKGDGRSRAKSIGSNSLSHSNRELGRLIGRSRIAEDLVIKAQEVLDRNKVHRIATLDNARAALIVQALFWQQEPETEQGYDEVGTQLRPRKRRGLYICNGVWTLCAISHLKELRVHQQETISRITDVGQRSQVAMCWWLACMMDAHMSAFYRRKPRLAIEDYTTDLSVPPPAAEQQGPHPLASSHAYQIWLNSSQQQVEMMRFVYHALFTPRSMTEGVSARKLEKLVSMAFSWRDKHLALVGAPSPTWPSHWNFADAVTACSSDMNYHVIWILMWEAIDEFGIAELKAADSSAYSLASLRHGGGPVANSTADMELDQSKIRGLSARIYEEALNGSIRSANLSQVLCDNGYLRLEAAIMKWAMSEAGFCLTRFKRPEVTSIIEGLRQYGQAFEECYEQANELERMASAYLNADPSLGSNRVPTPSSAHTGDAAHSSQQHFAPTSDHRRFSSHNDSFAHLQANTIAQQQGGTFEYATPPMAGYASNRSGQNGSYIKYPVGYPSQQQQQQQQQSGHSTPNGPPLGNQNGGFF